MTAADSTAENSRFDHEVAIVGGGPAGCSVGIFTARYGLDTVVFDRGNSSLQRCAYLENYLGFPAGIDVGTLYALMHDHAEEAGCEVVPDLVESVERADRGEGFVVVPQEGDRVTARRVVAATRYDGEYLRSLGGAEMFETHDHGDEEHEHFDRDYPSADGTTPVDGLYVASPTAVADHQAIMAAGRGARVGLRVVADVRRERGFPEQLAEHYDWVRREAELTGEWADPGRWREYADSRRPDDHDLDDERWATLRDREIDRRLDAYVSRDAVERRTRRGQERLLEHVDDEVILRAAREIETGPEPPAGGG